jgi:hypothetical protein
MRRHIARAKKKDPFEFRGSDDESDNEDKLSVKRKRRNSGNSTPHSVNGLDDGGGSPCDEESGLGSSDNDDKIHCSICAGEILEDSWLTGRCGLHVCESCHQDADEHLRHVKGNSDLEDAMTELCGLSHSVCLHEWPPEIVFPKRIIALRGVGLSSKNLPKISLDLNSPEGGGHGLFHRPFFDVDRPS